MVLAGVAASGRQVWWAGSPGLAALALAATIPNEDKTAQSIGAMAAAVAVKAHRQRSGAAEMAARAS
ncbi:MAG: hypothetical protein EA339_11130 [Rhodobacteraceae bacterium]|nr:MAG: hypothetical protein EA339_11130 [Paracoccaceae bacterium]